MRTDSELVNAVLNGDKAAFATLVKRYEPFVRAAAMNVLGDYAGTEDVVQDAFVQAYEKLPHLRKPKAFGPWVMKIAYRCALEAMRRKPEEAPLDAAADAAIEKPIWFDEDNKRLLVAVMKLPQGEKQVVMLRYFASHSVKDIAEILGRSVGTVTKQLSRARIHLREILKET